jgi:hypothetical protein
VCDPVTGDNYAFNSRPNMTDSDHDGIIDLCDPDATLVDSDNDFIYDELDNCVRTFNPR